MAADEETPDGAAADDAIRAYKTLLAEIIDRRPSGTRQRLADELGKNRSFVTQIASPAYSTPIPAKHLPVIIAVCHFGPAERDRFLAAYERAHPGKAPLPAGFTRTRHLSIGVPDLGDTAKNAALDRAVADFVQRIADLFEKDGNTGGHRGDR
ncbi:hypothetical protein [Kumtagia ephedrae]|uniref:Uncharacterized protein n=1 Tax=Kumtagia ephedrae TaxID=2116701 RepID=A0A2P7S3F5_9HYPH|nr:hypothetical protein [Mesorhizobium ephedrae]PSJ56983.1 hypothetical protein C7I84_19100 [Mesorhizobium ephedrae]